MSTPRLAAFISGGGRTLLNILDHIDSGDLNASVELVVASADCAGVERARDRGLTPIVIPGRIGEHDLVSLLNGHAIDFVALAGYLKLLPIPEHYLGRIVNIHPALLPEFGGPNMYGRRVHEAVLRSQRKISGCTVHFCDYRYDSGPIILQKKCDVLDSDTPDALASRVFELEKQAYPEALQLLASGLVSMDALAPRQGVQTGR